MRPVRTFYQQNHNGRSHGRNGFDLRETLKQLVGIRHRGCLLVQPPSIMLHPVCGQWISKHVCQLMQQFPHQIFAVSIHC